MTTPPEFSALQMPDLFLNGARIKSVLRGQLQNIKEKLAMEGFAGLAGVKPSIAFHSSGVSDCENLSNCNSLFACQKGT